ncbi:UDP-glycosyltransferase 86A1-like [Salvia miltiorrhiza]|uniref:UDP-glycosyltransferase 86A1-like n=1 Tax=Salvia miltiorrhiza TaxID=226208 RepID=UPI0025AC3589|nr:UDP-glycosyltransferase 86A1-like [Salvia miltiorrhiza]
MGEKMGHAIMVALPYQGHITPYTNLAIKLASKGIVVTFVHLEFIHHKLPQPDPFSMPRDSGLDIRYTTISDGFPLDHDREDDNYWESMFQHFWIRVDEFVGELIRSEPDLAPFLVTDTLFTWQTPVADRHNLLKVSFWTEPALVFSLAYHVQLLRQNGHFPCKDHVEEEIDYVDGVKSMNTKDLMPYLKESGTRSLVHRVEMKAFEEVKKADFILHNTVYELESETLSALNKIQRNYAVGPISFSKNLSAYAVSRSLWSESDCSEWLQSKPPGSVLYVSFGSFLQASKHVVGEIAYGLVLSRVSFVWVMREDADLPSGFRDEIKERGLVVPWCDQIRVLSNPAVGGFLTHCGWNSVLESMWCGVPMICYPLDYDQPTNRKLVVDDWKIGINLCEGECVEREEVSEKTDEFMNGGVSERLRQELKKVGAKLHQALESDGSSEANFDQFVKDLKAKLAG